MKVKDKKFYKCLEQILDNSIKETNNEEEDAYYHVHHYCVILDLRNIFKHRKITVKNSNYLYSFLTGFAEYYEASGLNNKKIEELKNDKRWTKESRYVYKFLSTYLKFREIKQNLYIAKHSFWNDIEKDDDFSWSKREKFSWKEYENDEKKYECDDEDEDEEGDLDEIILSKLNE